MGGKSPTTQPLGQPTDDTDASLDALAREYTPALKRYFRKRAPQPVDVEDLIQEVFTRLARRSDQSDIERPEAYLLRSAANVWRDFLRKRQTHASGAHDEYLDDQHAHEDRCPDHLLQGQQAVERVIAALNELPERSREVFVLRRVEGLRQRQVAALLGISESSVEKHMMKAIAHLADCLDNRLGGGS